MLKIGEWVRSPNNKPYKLKHSDFYGVSKKNKEWFNGLISWQPEEGEWCWFYGKICKILPAVPNESLYAIRVWNDLWESEDLGVHKSDIYEPFIGEIPTHIKGQHE